MTKRRSLILVIGLTAIIASIWVYTLLVSPSQQTLDQRVHAVASQLKCLVCQGESVADSPAMLSLQMRAVIRQQLQSGKTEQEVIQYFVSRYGDRILLSPPMQGLNLLAWFVPIALMPGGVILVFLILRNWQAHAATESNEVENAEPVLVDEQELVMYQRQIERELTAEDPVFSPTFSEVE